MTNTIQVIIGLAAVYTVFALLASWIQEQIAGVVGLRARTLKDGLLRLIDDVQTHANLLKQPTIASTQPQNEREPSYLSSHQFSSAVLSLANSANAVSMTGTAAFAQIVTGINALPPSRLKDGLLSLAGTAENDIEKFKKSVENWFDDQMDRVSGWYKRRTQLILIGLGVLLAASFNVDTLRIGYNFTHAPLNIDASKLSGDSAAAERYVSQVVFQTVTLGWPDASWCSQIPTRTTTAPANGSPAGAGTAALGCADIGPWRYWIYKVIGIILTAIAISFGAPFWFDTLSRFVNVRNSGPPPPTGSKDADK